MTQDLFAEKSLKLTKLNGKTIQEHNQNIETEYQTWLENNPNATEQDQSANRQQIIEAYKLKHSAFGTEVETVEKELFKAIKEGKPIILDEINAIPTPVLVSLNDVLQRRAGELVYAPGIGQVEIEPGFSVIMTGNLSNERVTYAGTNELNPAFLSRLDSFNYDYLPQSTDGNHKNQADPRSNELFHVIMSKMVDDTGTFVAPEAHESMSKLFKLAQLARTTQDIFTGRWKETQVNVTASGDSSEPELSTAVLSMRNVFRVIENWDGGNEKDLDKALWDGFISSITNVEDQQLVITQAHRFGFFTDTAKGYKEIEYDPERQAFVRFEDLRTEEYSYQRMSNKVIAPREMISLLYGEIPERSETDYPDLSLDELNELAGDPEEEIELSIEMATETSERIDAVKTYSNALTELYGSVCPIE